MIKLYIPILALTFTCCAPQNLSREELEVYLVDQSNGALLTEQVKDVKVLVAYRPTDILVSQAMDNEFENTLLRDSLRLRYSSYYYFIVCLSRNNREALHQVGSMEEYSELVQTMSFRMPQYVTLTTSNRDTIPTGDFMLNRSYGLSASTDLLFVFDKQKVKDAEWVQFNLNEFGLGVGNLRFRFFTKDLSEIPEIDFTKVSR